MAHILRESRLTVFADDGVTPLTPIGGASHSDALQVTTERPAPAGWKPYIHEFREPRLGLDPLNGTTEISDVTLTLVDARVGGSNSARWVTAFSGDGDGYSRLYGKKLLWEERLTTDGVAGAWEPYYTGFISEISAPEPSGESGRGPLIELVLKDARTEERREVFVGPPHHSVDYAHGCPVLPVGVQEYWGGASPYDRRKPPGQTPMQPIRGTLSHRSTGFLIKINDPGGGKRRQLTKALQSLADYTVTGPSGELIHPWARVWLKRLDTSATGNFVLGTAKADNGSINYNGEAHAGVIFIVPQPDGPPLVEAVGIRELPASFGTAGCGHPLKHMSMPPNGTEVEFYVFNGGPPRPDAPLLIDDVDAGTLKADMAAGKFSMLNDTMRADDPNDGAVAVKPIPVETASLEGLPDDTPLRRFAIEQVEKEEIFTAEQLSRTTHVYFPVRPNGDLYAVDIRLRPTTAAGLGAALDADDIITGDWRLGRQALGTILITSYFDRKVRAAELVGDGDVLDFPGHGFEPTGAPRAYLLPRATSADAGKLVIDARGLRRGDALEWPNRTPNLMAQTDLEFFFSREGQVASLYEQLYSDPASLRLRTRWTDRTKTLLPGQWKLVDCDSVPNLASNSRGGTRLFLCVGRQRTASGIDMDLIDAGPNSIAVVPVLAAPAQNGTTPKHSIDQAVTLNTSGEKAHIEVAVTDVGTAVRPAEDSELWKGAGVSTASGTIVIPALPSGSRVWTRGYSSARQKLPSPYTHPAGAGYVDTQALTSPTNVVGTVDGQSIVATCDPGEAEYPLMPVIDGVEAQVEPLPAGSDTYVFEDVAAGAHTVGFKHVDEFGGESSLATATPVNVGAANILGAPKRVHLKQFNVEPEAGGQPDEREVVGWGFQVGWVNPDGHAYTVVQLSQDILFGTIEKEVVADSPAQEDAFILTGRDRVRRYIRFGRRRDGWTDSEWSAAHEAYPRALLKAAPEDAVPTVSFDLKQTAEGELLAYVDGRADDDAEGAYLRALKVAAAVPTGADFPTLDSDELADPDVVFVAADDWESGPAIVSLGALADDEMALGICRGHSADYGLGPRVYDHEYGVSDRAIRATIGAAVQSDGTADLTVTLLGSNLAFPCVVTVYEGNGLTEVDSWTANAPGTWTQAERPALSGREVPPSRMQSWLATGTSAGGLSFYAETFADRNKNPNAWMSFDEIQAFPFTHVLYDEDTESVVITTPSGAKTYAGLSGGGTISYQAGVTVLDGATREPKYQLNEVRAGYSVTIYGGGTQRTIWSGSLRGPIPNAGDSGTDNGPQGTNPYVFAQLSYNAAGVVSVFLRRDVNTAGAVKLAFSKVGATDDFDSATLINFDAGAAEKTVAFDAGGQALAITESAFVEIWGTQNADGTGPRSKVKGHDGNDYLKITRGDPSSGPGGAQLEVEIDVEQAGKRRYNLTVRLMDANQAGGTLHAWTNPGGPEDGDTGAASLQHTVAAGAFAVTVNPADFAAALQGVTSNLSVKRVFFRYDTADARSTGIWEVQLPGMINGPSTGGPGRDAPVDEPRKGGLPRIVQGAVGGAVVEGATPSPTVGAVADQAARTQPVNLFSYLEAFDPTAAKATWTIPVTLLRDVLIPGTDYVAASGRVTGTVATNYWRLRVRFTDAAGADMGAGSTSGGVAANTQTLLKVEGPVGIFVPAGASRVHVEAIQATSGGGAQLGDGTGSATLTHPCLTLGPVAQEFSATESATGSARKAAQASASAAAELAVERMVREGETGTPGDPNTRATSLPTTTPDGTATLIDPSLQQILSMLLGTDVTDSLSRAVDRAVAKPTKSDPDTVDSVADGLTYGRPLQTALNNGQVDLALSGVIRDGVAAATVLQKVLDDGNLTAGTSIQDGAGTLRTVENIRDALITAVQRAAVAKAALGNEPAVREGQGGVEGDAASRVTTLPVASPDGLTTLLDTELQQLIGVLLASSVTDSLSRAVNRALVKATSADADDLDSVADGTSWKKVLATAVDGAGQVDLSKSGVVRNGTAASTILAILTDAGLLSETAEIEVGGGSQPVENTAGAQAKADAAQAAAEAFAAAEANLAQTTAEAYADGVVSDEEAARIAADTQALIDAAKEAIRRAGEASGELGWERGVREGETGTPGDTGSRATSRPVTTLDGLTTLLDPVGLLLSALGLDTDVTDSQGREVRRALAKALFSDTDDFDSVPNGTTWKKVVAAAVDAGGQVDLSKSGVVRSGTLASAILAQLLDDGNLAGDTTIEDGAGTARTVENERDARIKAQLRAALAVAVLLAEVDAREGMAGAPGERVVTAPLMTADGTQSLIDTLTGTIGAALLGPGGLTMEDVEARVAAVVDSAYRLQNGVTQWDGVAARALVRGRQSGTCKAGRNNAGTWEDGTAVVFPVPFASAPSIRLLGGITSEPRQSKWTDGFSPQLPQYAELVPLNPSATGFTPRGRFVQRSAALTDRDNNFVGTTLDAAGETEAVTMASAPAVDDTYYVRAALSFGSSPQAIAFPSGLGYNYYTVSITFAIDVNDGGGWVERAQYTESFTGQDGTTSGQQTSSWTGVYPIIVSGLDNTDQIRLRVVSVETGDDPDDWAEVAGTDVQYQTSATTPSYASRTPAQETDAQDRLTWEATA